MAGRINANWPNIDLAVCWPAGRTASPATQTMWSSIAERTEGKIGIRRGKVYELDQVQPGELTATLRNDDGVFDPTNTSSPFAGYVLPYRLLRMRAQWPPTANMLTADQATAFYASQGAGGAGAALPPNVAVGSGYTAAVIAGSSTSNAYQVQVPAAPRPFSPLITVGGFTVAPGGNFTGQAVLSGPQTMGAGATLAYVQVVFYGANGSVITTIAGTYVEFTASGQMVNLVTGQVVPAATVSGVVPANAAGAVLQVGWAWAGPGQAANSAGTFTISNLQYERASAASAWAQPGTWYSMFTGFVERWPQTWSSGGNYGTVALTAVDAFAWLSSIALNYPAYFDVLSLGPDFFYPLDEGAGASSFNDAAAKRLPLAPRIVSPTAGSGKAAATLTPGLTLQAAGKPIGIPGPVVQISQSDVLGSGAAMLDVSATGYIGSPSTNVIGASNTGWTRILAVNGPPQASATNADTPTLWCWGARVQDGISVYNSLAYGPQSQAMPFGGGLIIGGGFAAGSPLNHLYVSMNNFYGFVSVPDGGVVLDNTWHLVIVSLDATGTILTTYNNGIVATSTASTSAMPPSSQYGGATSDTIGALSPAVSAGGLVFNGQVAFAAQLPYAITAAQAQTLTNAFLRGWGSAAAVGALPAATETSGSRYQRLVNLALPNQPVRAATGNLATYGAATDLIGGPNPTGLLSGLQAVVDSECGQHYVDVAGNLVFANRGARWNQAPAVTFGEHAGEITYASATVDFDPTRLANDVTTTATSSSSSAATTSRSVGAASVAQYGTVTMQRTINAAAAADLIGASQYLLYQNATPAARLEALPVDVGANPGLWPQLLALDLGAPALVNRRPSNAPALALPGFLEQIEWDLDDSGGAKWTAQVSSGAFHTFAQLDSSSYGLLDQTTVLAY